MGRPPIGPPVQIRLTVEQLRAVDERVDAGEAPTRAEWVRESIFERLTIPRNYIASFVDWALDHGVERTEIGRAIEKPWSYASWLTAARVAPDLTPEDLEGYDDEFSLQPGWDPELLLRRIKRRKARRQSRPQ